MDSKKLKELIIMIKEDTLEKFLKIIFLKKRILSFGVCQNQKKTW